MRSLKHAAFYLAVSTLLAHELDAMVHHEWRLLPLLGNLSDDVAMPLFVVLHVPLIAGLLALVASPTERTRHVSRIAVAVFLVVHAGLHVSFAGRSDYEFSSLLSNALIFGGALLGASYLAIETRRPATGRG